MSELESFLNDVPVEEAETTETEAQADEVTEQAANTTETETAEPEQETESDGSPAEPEKETMVPIAGMLAEREKRQEYERQLKEANEKLAAIETPKKEMQIPDPLDDGEGFNSTIKQAFESIPEQVNDAVQKRLDQASFRRAERKYGDEFQEKLAAANQFLNDNPQINLPGDDVVEEAFEAYQKHLDVQQWQDPDFISKKEAEIEQRILEKLKAQQGEASEKEAAKQKLAETLTPSLATSRANGANKPVLDVPDPLSTTFNR